jgi:hypothetical protein
MNVISLRYAILATIACGVSSAAVTRAQAEHKSQTLVDFDAPAVLERMHVSEGVTISLTEPDLQTKNRALKIRVAPFSEHKNSWPSLIVDRRYFTSPIDASSYSQLTATIKNVTRGNSRNLQALWSTSKHSDGGRNMEGELFSIAGDSTSECSVSTGSFSINDPSSLSLLYIIFPPAQTAVEYQIESIRADYDPGLGSPAEKLADQVQQLHDQLETVERELDWDQIPDNLHGQWRAKLASAELDLKKLDVLSALSGSPKFRGKYNAAKAECERLSQRIGDFFLADKRDFVAWEIDPYINIIKTESPAIGPKALEKIDLQMAGNEFRNFTFMVSPCAKPLNLVVKVEADEALPASAIDVFETRYLPNRRSEETGEPLYPLEAPLRVPSGESRQITLRFNNRTQRVKPGTYRFSICLRDTESQVEKKLPGQLTVWDLELPNYDILPNNGYAEFNSSHFAQGKLLSLAVADMKAFGFNIVNIHPHEMPRITGLDANDRITKIDSLAFENRISSVVTAWREAPGNDRLRFHFSISAMYDLGVTGLDQPLPNARWQNVLQQWLSALVTTLEKHGITHEDWVLAFGDEANESALINLEIPCAECVKSADPRVRTYNNTSTPISDAELTDRFYHAFDILEPHLPSFKSQPALQAWIKKSDKPIHTYKCLADFGARGKNPYEYYRVYGWDLVKFGIKGIGIWTYCAQADAQPGSGFLMVYKHADRDQVLHSRRYEFLREGIDDFRYVWKLRETAKANGEAALTEADKLIQNAVQDVTANTVDTSRADYWRKQIAAEILKLQSTAQAGSQQPWKSSRVKQIAAVSFVPTIMAMPPDAAISNAAHQAAGAQ